MNDLLGTYVEREKRRHDYRTVPEFRYASAYGVQAGWSALTAYNVSFAGLDTNDTSQLIPADPKKNFISLPFSQTAVSIGHYVPNCPDGLTISLRNLARIFGGEIKEWNHSALVEDATCLTSANENIVVLYRTTSSSATYALTQMLSAVAPTLFNRSTFAWPMPKSGFEPLPSNDNMLFRIRVTNYSIGYLPWATRDPFFDIYYASLKHVSGETVKMSQQTVKAAGDFIDTLGGAAAYPSCAECWPLLATSYVALAKHHTMPHSLSINTSHPSSCLNIAEATKFFDWSLDNGNLPEFAPLSPNTKKYVRSQLATIKCNSKVVLKTSYVWLVRWNVLRWALLGGLGVALAIGIIGSLIFLYNEYLYSRDVKMLAAMVGDDQEETDSHLLQGLISNQSVDDDIDLSIPDEDGPPVVGNVFEFDTSLSSSSMPYNTESKNKPASVQLPLSPLSNSVDLIPLVDIAIGRLLGTGSFGDVFKAKYRRRTVAVKKIAISQDPAKLASFVKEIRAMQQLSHPNILTLIGFALQAPYTYIVSEYCKNGSLDVYMRENSGIITYRTRLDWMIDVANAMAYLHSQNITHRDLKLSNILVDANMQVKIADLGTAATGTVLHRTRAGTPDHSAPEILDGKPYDRTCDVYSFAICLWSLFSAQPLYPGKTMYEIITSVTSGKRPSLDVIPSKRLSEIIEASWKQDPADRPSFETLAEWLSGVSETDFQSFA